MKSPNSIPGLDSPGSPCRVLVVDDVAENRELLRETLEPLGYQILLAANGEAALRLAAKTVPDLILLDFMMPPGIDGLETCRRLKGAESTSGIPVLFITARNDLETLVAAFAAGAQDFIQKPFQIEEVRARVSTHLHLTRLQTTLLDRNAELASANEALIAEMRRREKAEESLEQVSERLSLISEQEAKDWGLRGFVGASAQFAEMVRCIRDLQVFPEVSVLILGESGTGKELIARSLHFGSALSRGPFIKENCAAVPGQLAESIFFGHVRGSFSGAIRDHKGRFEQAHGGTLFLDEIGDMPLDLQAKLLRVLEDGVLTPVGADREIQVKVRVIAATNVDLEEKIAAGQFRQDLYYRLARATLTAPPLRERLADIPPLGRHFAASFAAEMGRPQPSISEAVLRRLGEYPWPGNIRELRNVIERALIASRGGPIEEPHLQLGPVSHSKPTPRTPAPTASPEVNPTQAPPSAAGLPADLPLKLVDAEKLLLERALAQTQGNISKAAALLGVDRTWIYRKLRQGSPEGTEPTTSDS